MNLKKLSVATALSIGIMTIGGIAKADTGAACPICPPQVQAPQPCAPCCPTGAAACPVPVTTQVLIPQNTCPTEVYAPVCPQPACPQNAMVSSCPIQTCLPNCAPNAHVFRRQSYAFPDIGNSSLVIPKGNQMVQIGGNDEAVAVNAANGCGGLAGLPNYCGALTVLPSGQTGAAASLVCPEQVTQGLEISRCGIPGTSQIVQGQFNNPCMSGACNPCATGAAMPILMDPCNPCMPMGAACPVNPCDPCSPLMPAGFACPCELPSYQTGAACPCSPCEPCQQYLPTGAACPCDPCATGFAVPYNPCSPCQPCNPCGTGFAANQGLFPHTQGQARSIQTSSGLQIQRTVLMPVAVPTGAACPAGEHFPDVSNCATSGCDVNKLASKGILVGYPEGNYKPSMPIERDEFASALVSALELQNVPDFKQQIFNDVPLRHWANADIDKVYNRGLMAGLPNCKFNPDGHISRGEALSIMAKAIPGEMSSCDAQNILSQYCDANKIAAGEQNNVAEALASGLIKQLPDCNCIKPNNEASRGEVASMLENLRVKLALEACPQPTGAAAELQPQIVASTIPTLKMKFEDIISARTSEVGDRFVAKTTEAVNIDGILYPAGAEVRGKVAEVIRPGLGQSGAIRVDFHSIGFNGAAKTTLPREILSATVIHEDNPNIVGRFLAWPFSWPGKMAGIAGRTAGGAAIIAGNMTEGILTNFGNGTNELFNAKFRAAGRSYLMSLQDIGMGIFDTGRLAVSGTVGLVKETGDELAYVVKPDGSRIAQINPNEILSVAFPIQ